MNKYTPPKNTRKSVPKRKIVFISSFDNTFSEQSQLETGCSIKDLLELLETHFKSLSFASFLTATDVLALSKVCKSFYKVFNQEYLWLVIRLGNMNPHIRYLFWIRQAPYARYLCSLAFSIERKFRKSLGLPTIFDDVYQRIREEAGKSLVHDKVLNDITEYFFSLKL